MTETSIAEFLKARLDEAAELAKAAKRNGYPSADFGPVNGWFVDPAQIGKPARPISLMEGRYAAAHDPARTLREVETGRSILARYEDCLARIEDPEYPTGVARAGAREYEDFVLPNLAAAWQDHPEYRAEWRP